MKLSKPKRVSGRREKLKFLRPHGQREEGGEWNYSKDLNILVRRNREPV